MPDAADLSTTNTINVVYLARLREAFGAAKERLALPTQRDFTVADVLAMLRERGGAWAIELAEGRAVRVAVNHTMVAQDAPVRAGDEFAVLPPVTGG
jgi:molybdopterin synthase sulfur carrier subunit